MHYRRGECLSDWLSLRLLLQRHSHLWTSFERFGYNFYADGCAHLRDGIIMETLHPSKNALHASRVLAISEIDHIAHEIATAHRLIDEKTELLRKLCRAESEVVRRAEEAGASLQRLQWELDRITATKMAARGDRQ